MKVRDVMTANPRACSTESSLAEVAGSMWSGDFGCMPVVAHERGVAGMITDRDICMAAATRHARPSELRAADAMSHEVFSCTPEEDVETALRTMAQHRVRRLPVVDGDGSLVGILSLNDLALASARRKSGGPSRDAVMSTLQKICAHRQPEHAC